jgi:soluble lytic murein transglycosylase
MPASHVPTATIRFRGLRAAMLAIALLAGVAAAEAQKPTTVASGGGSASPQVATAPPAEDRRVPAPRPGDMQSEKDHVARYDAAIAAVRNHTLAAGDAENLKRALAKLTAGDQAGFKAARDAITDPIAAKIADWFRLRGGFGEAGEIRAFLAANPAWPNRDLLIQRYEEALFKDGGSPKTIKAFLAKDPPRTGAGHAALAAALLADGDDAGARRHARTAWRDHTFASQIEQAFLERLGKLLTAADHKWRLDRLLIDDLRWQSERAARAAVARRILPLLADDERKKAEARLAVFMLSAKGAALINAIGGEDKADWGLAFQRIQSLRRANKIDEAAKRMLAAPLDPASIVAPDGWWEERRTLAYAALRTGKPKVAYALVKAAGPLSANPLKEQTFMAGWLALSQLGDIKSAEAHFAAMTKAADGPLSRAKAHYWHGRALAALGRKGEARAAFTESGKSVDTFHGQLSRARLGGDAARIRIVPPAAPTPDQIARFSALDATRAAVIAHRAKLDSSIVRAFLYGLMRHFNSEAELGMTAHLAEAFGDTQMAVRIGKSGVARGHNLLVFSYPLHAFPAFRALRLPIPELPLLLGIARQESEFNGQTKSGAGARGILQVMPITARHVCRDYKIKCDINRLMTDNSYNTMMATAYIGDRMREFGGSYVLGFAGYNAGPGRARQWIREFGDPRDAKVDPIDWINRIPFEETREYVQKVMSNVQIYRARMAREAVPLRIAADLVRARGQRGEPPMQEAAADGKQ